MKGCPHRQPFYFDQSPGPGGLLSEQGFHVTACMQTNAAK